MRNVRLGELLLGTAGRAVMRGLLRGNDADVRARVDEIQDIVAKIDDDPYATSVPVPEFDAVEGYTRWAATYDGGGNPLIDLEEPIVRGILEGLPPGPALDVCCGTGRHTGFLAGLRHAVVGIDATPAMLQRAREANSNALFVRGDTYRLPVRDGCAHLVVCALALTHFDELRRPVEELARVAKRGGHIVISDLHPFIRALGGGAFFVGGDGTFGLVREHVHLHSEYLAAFQSNGLEIVQCHEPVLTERQLEMFGFTYREIPEAVRMADEGLPFALIWHLRRES